MLKKERLAELMSRRGEGGDVSVDEGPSVMVPLGVDLVDGRGQVYILCVLSLSTLFWQGG